MVVLRNRVTDAHRVGQRFVPLLTFPDADASEIALPFSLPDEPVTDDNAPTRQLARAFERLPRRQREAVYLRYYQEMDYTDIARVMGVKERTVYNLIHEGLHQLRQHLGPARWFMLAGLGTILVICLKSFW